MYTYIYMYIHVLAFKVIIKSSYTYTYISIGLESAYQRSKKDAILLEQSLPDNLGLKKETFFVGLKKRGVFDGVPKNVALEKLYSNIFETNYDHSFNISNINTSQNNECITDVCLHGTSHNIIETTFSTVDNFLNLQSNVITKLNKDESKDGSDYFKQYKDCVKNSPEDSDAWYEYVYLYIYRYACISLYVYIYGCTYTSMPACIYIYIYIYIYKYICIYIYVYTYINMYR
jgi:hypothetical protein